MIQNYNMKQEQKDLLLKDLSARLPYGVKCCVKNNHKVCGILNGIIGENIHLYSSGCSTYNISVIKPYLFPLSSMNEEQKRKYNFWKHEVPVGYYEYGDIVEKIELFDSPESFEYLIENHFDYHGLIERGFAIDATGKNIY